MKGVSLFSGVGGLDVAAEAAGIKPVVFCEIEPFCIDVLKKRWPDVPVVSDIRTMSGYDYEGIDVVWGGFPCQDLSVAGKKQGLQGERSGLWYEMLRFIKESRPNFVIAENVRGACNLALPTVQSGLEGEGYEVRSFVVSASAFGAPHKRERLFVLGIKEVIATTYCKRKSQS